MSDAHKIVIKCAHCGKSAEVVVVWGDGRDWSQLPKDWFVTDTYPPGDNGLWFACSADCVRSFKDNP